MSSQKCPVNTASVDRDDVHIAIFCAVGVEADAIEQIFDEIYETKTLPWQKNEGDHNSYTIGKVLEHQVALVYLAGIGKINAATAAAHASTTFRNIEIALVVGICGGVPQYGSESIYLGDIIISTEVVQADFGRERTDRFVIKESREGNLGPAPNQIRSFLQKLQTTLNSSRLITETIQNISHLLQATSTAFPDIKTDVLFDPAHYHKHHQSDDCVCRLEKFTVCEEANSLSCSQTGCNVISRRRARSEPTIFFGSVASTDSVKRHGLSRDKLAQEHGVLAFEMEGAGVWKVLPTMVIKSVCDYADSHKNKDWQAFAAISAAATCKSVMGQWHVTLSKSLRRKLQMEPLHKEYLDSLNFVQLDTRLGSIEPAYPGTCDWIFEAREFRSWIDPKDAILHHRVLWIKGKPGSGKSTIMKHLYHGCAKYFPEHTIATYFFHARGTILQRSPLGMMRSLLYQIFKTHSELLNEFINQYKIEEDYGWTFEVLQNFILLSAQKGWLPKTVILIDALDECQEEEARELVRFCDNLAMNTIGGKVPVYICLSIRQFPNITSRKSVELNIDQSVEHSRALRRYAQVQLNRTDSALVSEVLKRSHHVFLWVKLVSGLLNRLDDEGNDLKTMERQLEDIPVGLYEVFTLLFNPSAPVPKTVLMLQLVLYTLEPLSPESLYMLINVYEDPSRSKRWPDLGVSVSRLSRFISTISRGVVEIVSGKESVTQFIHESVRDFLRKSSTQEKAFEFPAEVESHLNLAICCSRSLLAPNGPQNLEELDHFPHILYSLRFALYHISFGFERFDFDTLVQKYCQAIERYTWYYVIKRKRYTDVDLILGALMDSILTPYPPIGHAAIIWHKAVTLEVARQNGESAIKRYKNALRLAKLDNKPEILRTTLDVAVSSNLSFNVLPDLLYFLESFLQTCLNFKELWIHIDGTSRLHSSGVQSYADDRKYYYLDEETINTIEKVACYCLHQFTGLDKLVLAELMATAVKLNSSPLVATLIDVGIPVTSRFDESRPSNAIQIRHRAEYDMRPYQEMIDGQDSQFEVSGLSVAIQRQYFKEGDIQEWRRIIIKLLENKADPNIRIRRVPVLFYAILQQDDFMIELLLKHGADKTLNVQGVSAAHVIAQTGFIPQSMNVLDLGYPTTEVGLCTPLHVAAIFGQTALVERSTCESGLDAQNCNGRTALHESIINKNFRITEKLILMGANTKLRDKIGRTALHYAVGIQSCQRYDLRTLELLIAASDVNARDAWGETCLDMVDVRRYGSDDKGRHSEPPKFLSNTQPIASKQLSKWQELLIEILCQAGAVSGVREGVTSSVDESVWIKPILLRGTCFEVGGNFNIESA